MAESLTERLKGMNIFSKEYREGRIPFLKLWEMVLMDYFSQNNSIKGPSRPYNFYGNAQSFYSGANRVSYMFSIDGYGSSLPVGFADYIREDAPPGVRVNLITKLEEADINWESPRMKNMLNTWQTNAEGQGQVTAYNVHENLLANKNISYKEASLWYLAGADIGRGRSLYTVRTLMLVSGFRGPDFDKYIKNLVKLCEKRLSLSVTRVNRNLNGYLHAFSPFVMGTDKGVFSEVGNTVLPDELIARTRSYDQGKVGDKGIYWSTDIFSDYPSKKEVKKDGVSAENWVIIAETGGGKSYFVKVKLLELAGLPRYMLTILDIEGDEYVPLAHYIANGDSVEILNMGEGQGNYFDPVAIPITGNREIDAGMYSLSKSFTLALLQTLIGRSVVTDARYETWVRKILNKITEDTYAKAGVTTDQTTWVRSQNLGLHDIYMTLMELYMEVQRKTERDWGMQQAFYANPDFRKTLDIVVSTMEDYFGANGVRRHIFANKVNMMDMWDTKLVLCSFGLKGKSAHMIGEVQMGLIQLYAGMITAVRSNFAKAQDKYNVKVFEELQRYSGLPDADKVFQVAFTGGRKLGDVNIVISNEASGLLNDDRFKVFENYTSIAIGAVANAETRRRLCEVLSLEKHLDDLDKIALAADKNKASKSKHTSIYKYAFLSRLDKSLVTIGKVVLPEELAQSELFRTGNTVDE